MRDSKALNYALKLLKFSQRSEKEIYDRLKKRNFDETSIKLAISILKNNKLIDDEYFAREWISSKIRKGKSIRLMKTELYKKGIDKEIIEKIINELKPTVEEEKEIVKKLIQKKLQIYKGLENDVIERRILGFLLRRGFSYDLINSCLNELKK